MFSDQIFFFLVPLPFLQAMTQSAPVPIELHLNQPAMLWGLYLIRGVTTLWDSFTTRIAPISGVK